VRDSLTRLTVLSLRRRILLLGGFAGVFLTAALTVRAVAGHGEHVEPDRLFELGGYPLVSALLLLGWTIGRFPILATLVMTAGLFSADLASGHVRLIAARPVSLARVYGLRLATLAIIAFLISAVLMPAFDFVLLGRWAGHATLMLIVAYVTAYGGLVAFLSVWTRADAWIALALVLLSLVWATLRRSGFLDGAPALTSDLITFVLPPQEAFFALENAFAEIQPIPWDAFGYAVGYGLVFLFLAGALVVRREL
jgi:hypothetical protein